MSNKTKYKALLNNCVDDDDAILYQREIDTDTMICGTIKNAEEIGYCGHVKYIWLACIDCGKERWVALCRDKPVSIRCRFCANSGINNHFRGKHHTEETKNKMRGKNNPNYGNYGKDNSAWKGGRTKDNEGYVSVWVEPTHSYSVMRNHKGYVYEHRLIMAQYLGRVLREKEAIHHINGIRDDNRIENIELFSSNSAHLAYHRKLKKETETMICGLCGNYNSDTLFCSKHPGYGELCERDSCQDYRECD